tara:strand:- start:1687 stop:3222 length:1536 start_codon:yes stop_codon:yes gene_type:complete
MSEFAAESKESKESKFEADAKESKFEADAKVIKLYPNKELMSDKSNDLSKESNDLPKELYSVKSYSVELTKLLGSGSWNDVYSFKLSDNSSPDRDVKNYCIRLSKPKDKDDGKTEDEKKEEEKRQYDNNGLESQITLFSECKQFIPKSFQTGEYEEKQKQGSYIIMEKLGLDLPDLSLSDEWKNWLKEKNKIHRIRFFKQIVECVECMHNKANLCHFDIKADNMMILDEIIVPNNPVKTIKNINENLSNKKRVVKLIDFGTSKKAYRNEFYNDFEKNYKENYKKEKEDSVEWNYFLAFQEREIKSRNWHYDPTDVAIYDILYKEYYRKQYFDVQSHTPEYMSPEMKEASKQFDSPSSGFFDGIKDGIKYTICKRPPCPPIVYYDLRADLWALGVIYGHLHLEEDEMPKLFELDIKKRYRTTNEILKDLDEIIKYHPVKQNREKKSDDDANMNAKTDSKGTSILKGCTICGGRKFKRKKNKTKKKSKKKSKKRRKKRKKRKKTKKRKKRRKN